MSQPTQPKSNATVPTAGADLSLPLRLSSIEATLSQHAATLRQYEAALATLRRKEPKPNSDLGSRRVELSGGRIVTRRRRP